MDAQKENTAENSEEVKTEETTTENSNIGAPSEEEERIVKEAKAAAETKLEAEKLKATNLEKEDALLKRKEALAALGGGSPAGDKPSKPEETPSEYKDRVMRNEI